MTRLGKGISILIVFSGCLSISNVSAQGDRVYNLFVKYADLYNSGDFIGAENCMLTVLESEQKLSPDYLIPAYNNLGLIKMSLGLYSEVLNYYNKAEFLAINKKDNLITLAGIYNNKSRIYTFQRSFPTAIEFLEKSVRIYQTLEKKDISVLNSLSTAYLNLGIIYYELRDYTSALDYLGKSARLKLTNDLPETELTFLNLAKTYYEVDSISKAEEYFTRCLKTINIKFGENYFRMSEVYFGYGDFLSETGRFPEALDAHTKALNICLQNYGNKHSLTALSYKQLADYYFARADYPSSLDYYQKSLIAVEPGFNDNDIFSNPGIDSSLLQIRLLDILKNKAIALECFANEQNDQNLKLKAIKKSLETMELCLDLIDRIRNNYPAEESRIYLAENEKETYLFAVHIASALNSFQGESSLKNKIYSMAERAKAAVLRNEIAENELLYPAVVPNSAMTSRNKLAAEIGAYNRLITEESVKNKPDSNKISLWKDALFDMNREMEKKVDEINLEFPQYRELILKTKPAGLAEIQKHLKRNETIVEYLLSNKYKDGKRDLYTFVITRDDLEFRETGLDSLFSINAEIIRNSFRYHRNNNVREVAGALSYMYTNLIKPVEGLFAGKRLVIIPDEEIARLPFDAFLKEKPGLDQTDYEGLQYLIYKYSISYCYSSSLISGKSFPLNRREEVLSFAPDYDKTDDPGHVRASLHGTGVEIESINKWFRGRKFEGNLATETNFRIAMQRPAVYHLAMHSISDSTDSRYSYLLFDSSSDTLDDGKLYNYEISLLRLKSPMVVLSACNSGTGTLYHGEGLMSLARGFILAGAESVIRTAWEVNDEISADIISRFYKHLSKGMYKDDALRLAMLGYLKESPPAYSDPYYWAAYEVLGDNAPVKRRFFTSAAFAGMAVIICFVILILYLRRRKIFSARSM